MIFRRKRKKRVEPRFEGRSASGGSAVLAVTADDRAAAPAKERKKSTNKKTTGKAAGSRGKTPSRSGTARRSKSKAKARRGRSLIGGLFYWSFIACIWGGIGVAGILLYYGAQLPSASTWAVPDRPPNVKIVAVDGQLVANRGVTGGEAVGLHRMSPYIPQAVVAIEDRRFYSHFGVDPKGFARAMTANVAAGRLVQGGSTLTQQLAKNLFLSPERTIGRKVQEVLLALWLEQKYTKDQILEMYLNRVYFGSGSYGVEAASRRYFNKPARDVSLPEAAVLAGLLKAPSRLSPANNPQAAEQRAQLVLSAMRDQGMVSDTEMTAALSRPATKAARYWSGSEHYVADAVMSELPKLIGNIGEDVIVDTTIDLLLQKFAEKSIRDIITENAAAKNVTQGALVSVDTSGAVRAMVGGHDYGDSQFDRASGAKRQPGSAFKPFVYLAALETGLTPLSVRNDAPVRIGKWSPENYGGKYHGPVTLTTALSKSLNSVAAQLIAEVGAGNVAKVAKRLGIASDLQANASLSLGTSEVSLMELTSAYVPFASGGYRANPFLIRRVTTLDGKVLYEAAPEPVRVMSAQAAGMMNAMMTKTIAEGTARKAAIGRPAAGKTGTTQNSRDALFVGYTAQLVTGVWFGNDDGAPMNKVTGGSLPAEAWKLYMTKAHQHMAVADLPGYVPIQIVPKARPQEAIAQRPVAPLNDPAAFPPPPANSDQTASTAPRPQLGVGQQQDPQKTVLDFLLGR